MYWQKNKQKNNVFQYLIYCLKFSQRQILAAAARINRNKISSSNIGTEYLFEIIFTVTGKLLWSYSGHIILDIPFKYPVDIKFKFKPNVKYKFSTNLLESSTRNPFQILRYIRIALHPYSCTYNNIISQEKRSIFWSPCIQDVLYYKFSVHFISLGLITKNTCLPINDELGTLCVIFSDSHPFEFCAWE